MTKADNVSMKESEKKKREREKKREGVCF